MIHTMTNSLSLHSKLHLWTRRPLCKRIFVTRPRRSFKTPIYSLKYDCGTSKQISSVWHALSSAAAIVCAWPRTAKARTSASSRPTRVAPRFCWFLFCQNRLRLFGPPYNTGQHIHMLQAHWNRSPVGMEFKTPESLQDQEISVTLPFYADQDPEQQVENGLHLLLSDPFEFGGCSACNSY